MNLALSDCMDSSRSGMGERERERKENQVKDISIKL